jgi:hypothetical protein
VKTFGFEVPERAVGRTVEPVHIGYLKFVSRSERGKWMRKKTCKGVMRGREAQWPVIVHLRVRV